jgi:hypothetical protein
MAGITITSATVSGSINNTGSITSTGISVNTSSTINGSILSSGTLVGGITLDGTSQILAATTAIKVTGPTFTGGISNAGLISAGAGYNGIFVGGTISTVANVTTFSGGITNAGSGTISAPSGIGIAVNTVTAFSGNISNAGTITAATGIGIVGSTITGSIIDNGTILATSHGISIDSASAVISATTAIKVTGPTFTGGISNAGLISAGASYSGIFVGGTISTVANVTTFSGGITNAGSGTISAPSGIGIAVNTVTAFSGNISNAGTISAKTGIGIVGSTITGSIIDNGTILATSHGISIDSKSAVISATTAIKVTGPTFTGGISNAGLISAGAGYNGIYVGGVTAGLAANVTTFSGGITNAGTISAATGIGIAVNTVTAFSGNISNSGTISAKTGIGIVGSTITGSIIDNGSILATNVGISIDSNSAILATTATAIKVTGSTFTGGITNAGLISAAGYNGIFVGGGTSLAPNVTTFSGGITNAGTISAATGIGIAVNTVTAFSGNISNSGTISAKTGIGIVGSTITGSIIDNGTILATSHGISIDSASAILATTATAIKVTGPTFTGGISNAGLISAAGAHYGIYVGGTTGSGAANVTTFSGGITNAGTISVPSATGIIVDHVSVFSGGITNSGTINSGGDGIYVYVTTFSGGITISGTISASGYGIYVGMPSGAQFGSTSAAGGVTNSGTITAKTGIFVYAYGAGAFFSGSIVNSASGSITATSGDGIAVAGVSSFAGGISNAGTISAVLAGIYVTGVSSFAGGISNAGTISAGSYGIYVGMTGSAQFGSKSAGGITNSGTGTISAHTGIAVYGAGAFSGGISNAGRIAAVATGIALENVSSFAGGISNSGTITAGAIGIAIDKPLPLHYVSTFSGGITNSGLIAGNTGIVVGSNVSTFIGAIANSGTISGTGGTAIDVSGANNAITINQTGGLISGAIKLSANADVLNISGGSIAGNIMGKGSLDTVNFTLGASNTFTYAAAYGFTGINQVNINSGTVVLNGANNASYVDVYSGGTLGGTGTLDPLTVTIHSGATFAPGTPGVPGTSMTIAGNLAFQSGVLYLVYVNPTTASFANVTGAASLAGTVNAVFASGSYVSKQYTILTTTGGLGGTTFAGLSNTNLPAGASDSLSYSADDVYLNLKAGFTQYTGLNINQQNVANALTNYFNTTGGIPAAFFGLSPNGLTRIDGEAATDASQGAFLLMDQFLELMLDPFVDGRGGSGWPSGGATANGFAPEQAASLPPDIAAVYNSVLKASPPATTFDQRWTTWGAAFGGSNTTAGDAAVGSHDSTAQIYGYAAGMDYHYSPDGILGFALAGGGTNWGLAQGLGGGRSDAFQAGLYSATRWGPAYVAAALDASNYWMSTSRVALGDQLAATFMAQGYGVRAEAGYRFATPLLGVTPYAALRALSFHSPGYSEGDPSGGGFGLSYNATTATDTRSELGARFDDPTIVAGMPLVLRGRLAWAHDWASNPAINATFETLPGAGFTVNGARIPQDSALVSGGAQLFVTSRWSLLARAEGQFAAGSQTYAGSGTLRYSW